MKKNTQDDVIIAGDFKHLSKYGVHEYHKIQLVVDTRVTGAPEKKIHELLDETAEKIAQILAVSC